MRDEQEQDPWILIDDIDDAAAQEPGGGHGAPSGQGWDSFTAPGSWNGMPVTPPGDGGPAPAPRRRRPAIRPPRTVLGPRLVSLAITFTVACAGVALVIASIRWPSQTP